MEKFDKLKDILKRLPGIGNKSSERIGFYILNQGKEFAAEFAIAVKEAAESVKVCSVCGAFSEHDPCEICTSNKRTRKLMLVENAKDVFIFEKSHFKGKYHVLGGLLSPLDGIGPEDISIDKLLKRLDNENIEEIIIALSASSEGETTTMYINNILKEKNIHITRLAFGIPFGSNFEFIDEYTLSKSLENRQEVKN